MIPTKLSIKLLKKKRATKYMNVLADLCAIAMATEGTNLLRMGPRHSSKPGIIKTWNH